MTTKMNKESQAYETKESTQRPSRKATHLIFIFFFSLLAPSRANSLACNPFQPQTCRFGGQCTSVTTLYFELGNSEEVGLDQYKCRCNVNFNLELEGFNPVCGDNGRTYVNDLERRVDECAQQTRIGVRCNKGCWECDSTDSTAPVEPICPVEDSSYCFNFGKCLLNSGGFKSCRCRTNFFGERCQFFSPSGAIPSIEDQRLGFIGRLLDLNRK